MAYGERYYHEFCDEFGNSYRASILEQDYAGTAELLTGGPSPVVYLYESHSDYKFDTIRAKRCVLTMVASNTFNTQNLYTGDEHKFQVKVTKNGITDFLGYMMPNGIKEDFTSPPYYVQITATDYLPGIKNIKYVQEDGSFYAGRQTFRKIIQEATGKTLLALPLETSVNVYPTGVTPSAAVDPLEETDVNPDTFIENRNRELPDTTRRGNPRPRDKYPSQTAKSDKPRPMNCYEVLSYNAALFNSRIFQEAGRWRFERINYKYLENQYIRRYDASGTYTGYVTAPPPRVVDCNSPIKFQDGRQTLAMDRVFKRVTTEYRFAFNDAQNNVTQFLRNGGFEDFVPVGPSNAQFNYWRGQPGIDPHRVFQGADVGLWIKNRASRDIYAESWPIEAKEGDVFSFSFRVRLRPGETADNVQYALIQIFASGRFSFTDSRPTSGTSNRVAYLSLINNKGEWYDAQYWIVLPISPPKDAGKMMTFNFTTDPIPGSGQLYVRLFGTADDLGAAFVGLDTKPGVSRLVRPSAGVIEYYDIKVGKVNPVDQEVSETAFVEEQEGNFTDEPEIITIINADDSTPEHISGIKIADSGIDTSLWTVDGQPEYQPRPIGNIVSRSVLEQYKQPYHIIEGSLKGPNLKFSDVFRFEMDGVEDELFLVQRGSFDLINARLNDATFVQITDDAVDSDGTIDGNDTTPNWTRTGSERCVRGLDGKTTGDSEVEEKDFNPYSPTYGQTRWTNIGDSPACHGNTYYEYLWGASGEVLDTDDLINWQFAEGDDDVTVWFDNDGGKWLWFLHRPDEGTVISVLDNEGEETISDWSYQPNVTVEGVTFKAMRMNYYTGVYNYLPKTFVFG